MLMAVITSSLIFFLLHSLLASLRCKRLAARAGIGERAYRLVYVILAVLMTVIWLAYVRSLPDQPLYSIEGPAMWLMRLLQFTGIVIFIFSLLPIDGLAFLGLRRRSGPLDDFVESGIYRFIRHPMYSGLMLVMLASPEQSLNGLLLYVLVCLYLIIGSRLEENRLMACCPAYADYRRRVPAFIPSASTLKTLIRHDS